jgi:sec-independent protein translocase protein TatA
VPSIGFGEILVIVLLALIIFGPRRLPEMGKTIGKSLREFRKATAEIRSEIQADLGEPPTLTAAERARQVADRQARATTTPVEPAPSETAEDSGRTEGEAPPT